VSDLAILASILLILLAAKGFFSGSELALVSSDKLMLQTLAEKGHKGAKLVLRLFRQPESLLTTTLIGTNIATMTMTVLGTTAALEVFGSGGEIFAILILTPIMLIFGEIVPKSVFQQRADSIAIRVIVPLAALRTLFYPLVQAFGWIARQIVGRFGPPGASVNPYATRQRLRMMLDSADRAPGGGVLDRERIRRAILLADMTVGEAMVPLARVHGVPSTAGIEELMAISRASGHRRIPVFEGNLSNIVGIANWSVWEELEPEFGDRDLSDLRVDAHFISTIQRLDELLPVLMERGDHMVVAVDEYGTAQGVVTLEDLMEILLGDVADVLHLGPPVKSSDKPIRTQQGGVYLMDGRARLAEVSEMLDIDLPTREFHSLAGLLTNRLRRIPQKGDVIDFSGYRFSVDAATSRAATVIRIEPI